MGRPEQAHPAHRLAPSGIPAPRWVGVVALSLAIAAVPALTPPLAPMGARAVRATHVALAADALLAPQNDSTPTGPAIVIDDFAQGGLARVLLHQLTSRTTDPDQLQILHDFFEGGVFQSEAHRFLQLFADPQQQQFINDFVTGGVIQIVRNRILDATGSPEQRAAIISLFPDEVTDYRGALLTVFQRRLLAAARGNTGVIALVNAVFDNPFLGAVRQLLGGGPLVGTALDSLPVETPANSPTVRLANPDSQTPEKTVVEKTVPEKTIVEKTATSASSTPTTAPESVAAPTGLATSSPGPAVPSAAPSPSAGEPTQSLTSPAAASSSASGATDAAPGAEPKGTKDSDVLKTGNKVEPTTTAGAKRQPPARGGWGTFGQLAEAIAKGLAGADASAPAPAAAGGDTEGPAGGASEG